MKRKIIRIESQELIEKLYQVGLISRPTRWRAKKRGYILFGKHIKDITSKGRIVIKDNDIFSLLKQVGVFSKTTIWRFYNRGYIILNYRRRQFYNNKKIYDSLDWKSIYILAEKIFYIHFAYRIDTQEKEDFVQEGIYRLLTLIDHPLVQDKNEKFIYGIIKRGMYDYWHTIKYNPLYDAEKIEYVNYKYRRV